MNELELSEWISDCLKIRTSQSPEEATRLQKKGWTLIGDEDNYGQYDAVLIKY